MMYLDLGELDTVFEARWFWSTSRPALARFRREKHLGDPWRPLDECVRDLVEQKVGHRPSGRVCLLTNLQYFGYGFNPVSYYYCYGSGGELEACVAEVTNTPWGEQDSYVLSVRDARRRGRSLWFRDQKKMHVSPFMPMQMQYDWFLSEPGERLNVYMTNSQEGERKFSASLVLQRRAISTTSLAGVLLRYPLMTVKVILAIHWQAFRLWRKRLPVFAHPAKLSKTSASGTH